MLFSKSIFPLVRKKKRGGLSTRGEIFAPEAFCKTSLKSVQSREMSVGSGI